MPTPVEADPADQPATDRPVAVADGLWTVDAAPIHPLGLTLPVRMTVLRLADGGLLLYSPTRHSPALQRALEALGPVRHLVAPNVAHWMFARGWQRACPGAVTWGAPGLRQRAQVRAAGLRVDADLGDAAPPPWRGEVDQVLVTSGPFSEVAMFHRASRTLLVADLVVNVEPDSVPPLSRGLMEAAGMLAPDGRAPVHLRMLLKLNGRAVGEAAERLIALRPERVIMCHGHPHTHDAPRKLARALDWFAGPAGPRAGVSPVAAGAVAAGLLLGLGLATARARGARR